MLLFLSALLLFYYFLLLLLMRSLLTTEQNNIYFSNPPLTWQRPLCFSAFFFFSAQSICVCVLLPFFCYFTVLCTLFFTSLILLCLETLSNAHTKCTIMRVFSSARKKRTLVKEEKKNFISLLMASTILRYMFVQKKNDKIKIQKDPNHIFNLLFTDHPTIRLFISIILMCNTI